MMKRQISYLSMLLWALSMCSACASDEVDAPALTGDKGILQMNISATRADEGGAYDPFAHITVRLFNGDGGLLRKYSALTDIPARLELLRGAYRVAVVAGEAEAASFTKRIYSGEKTFEVKPGITTPVEVVCQIDNTITDVKFDKTVSDNFGANFYAWVVIGEKVDEQQAELGHTPGLRFDHDANGYFTLPEGVSTLAWKFKGEHATRGTIVKEGVLRSLTPRLKYKLTFHFSKDLPGFVECFAIRVDPSTDDKDDTIIFSPDPTIAGEGFDLKQTQEFIPGKTGDKSYKIATMAPMQSVTLRLDGSTYNLFGDATTPVDGITVAPDGTNALRVTLSGALFAGRRGGTHTLLFHIADTDGGSLISESDYRLQGLLPITASDYDLWHNTATLRALILDPDITTVNFGLRAANAEWQEVAGVKGADGNFAATFTPTWTASTNENNLPIYTPAAGTGVTAATTYDCRATIGATQSATQFTTAAGDKIYNAGMDLWSSYNVRGSSLTGGSVAYPNENSATAFWVGGNNKQTNALCTGGTVEGSRGACAKLQPMVVAGIFAAGNLFTGTFECGSGFLDMFGFADFGAKYTFSARPKALRVHYNATVTTVTNGGGPLTSGIDPGRIMVCITDWSARHRVKSGKSYDEATFWDPLKTTSLHEGAILGYASKMITESTSGWQTLELPIVWYNHQAAPSAESYSLVISCVTSAYGDYVAGSSNNRLNIEDFEWVY
ncbi:MAG: DUF4493 domain-containing protein [Alistipes sp.]